MSFRFDILASFRTTKLQWLVTLLFFWGMVANASVDAQTLTIRLLNAKSGKGIGKKKVTIKWDKNFRSSEVLMNSDGVGHIDVPSDAKQFIIVAGPRVGEDSYRIAYRDCSELPAALIEVSEVMQNGLVPQNNCGHQNAIPRPGEIVFWALPLPFWKPDFQ